MPLVSGSEFDQVAATWTVWLAATTLVVESLANVV